jgi:hypothetical protein
MPEERLPWQVFLGLIGGDQEAACRATFQLTHQYHRWTVDVFVQQMGHGNSATAFRKAVALMGRSRCAAEWRPTFRTVTLAGRARTGIESFAWFNRQHDKLH